jgi:hypothetical protein
MLLVLTLLTTIAYAAPIHNQVLVELKKYEGVKEVGYNRGEAVETILKRTGLPPGQSWCMALVYNVWLDSSQRLHIQNPVPQTGGCSIYYRYASKRPLTFKVLQPSQVLMGVSLEPADTPIWIHSGISKDGSFSGHTGILVSQLNKSTFKTFEGNTYAGDSGNQANGDGTAYKTRKIDLAKFKVLGFIRVR